MGEITDILILKSQAVQNSWEQSFELFLKHTLQNIINREPVINIANTGLSASEAEQLTTKSSSVLIILSPNDASDKPYLNQLNSLHNILNSNPDKFFLIISEPIDKDLYPQEFYNILSFNFYDLDPQVNLLRIYENKPGSELTRLFWSKMVDLAYKISGLFDSKPQEAKLSDKQHGIYLAETTPDQFENRDIIKRELEERGFIIYPEIALKTEIQNITANIDEALEKSYISLHIIGNNFGDKIKGLSKSLIDTQLQQSANYCITNADKLKNQDIDCFRLIWIAPDIKINDDNYKLYIDKLKQDDKIPFTEIVQAPLEELKSVLISKITGYSTQPAETGKTDASKKTVYLIHEKKDTAKVFPVADLLIKNNFEVLQNDFITSDIVAKHRVNLVKSDAVIIFDDNCPNHWVVSKLKDLIKAPGYGRITPYKAKAVISTQQYTILNRLQNDDMFVIDGKKDLSEAMQPFLQKIMQ